MSVFDVPRLHFRGTATTQLPTGPRSGLVDLATNTALLPDGRPAPGDLPPERYHGLLGAAKGDTFGGNGHFAVAATLVAAEPTAGEIDTHDPVVGSTVDLWGHYNEYLATTVNRARIFDVDPSSNWTTALAVGQFGFGRRGRSHDVGYLLLGDVQGMHPARWHDSAGGPPGGWTSTFQFVVSDHGGLTWFPDPTASPVTARLRETVGTPGCSGLVVQFVLGGPPVQGVPGGPSRRPVWGTIAPWRPAELRTYPAGRLLVPERGARWPSPVGVEVAAGHVTVNLVGSPSAWPGLRARRLEVRTGETDRLVAVLDGIDADLTSGVVTVPARAGSEVAGGEALLVVERPPDGTAAPTVLLRERETVLQTDDAVLIVDHPRGPADDEQDVEVAFRAFHRGRPAAVDPVHVTQYVNPRAIPRDPVASRPHARSGDVRTARLRGGRSGDAGEWGDSCTTHTDGEGRGWFGLRGARAGCARVLLSAEPHDRPCGPGEPGSAVTGYDNDDRLGFWSGAGWLSLRVLPDDWHLADIPEEQVTFELLYREIFAYYEFLYSFMKDEVFSLAERIKVENYAQLIWQMSDPRNLTKTYYMPPTRDLSAPKAELLRKFLIARRSSTVVPEIGQAPVEVHRRISGRGELVAALRQAVAVELAVMLQYLYAAYSVPTYAAAEAFVHRGLWTPEQLRVALGDGGETLDGGVRGKLVEIAREEMIHFLLVNNILMALGEPFCVPALDFGALGTDLPVPLDLCLEGLDIATVARFIAIEQPAMGTPEVRRPDLPTTTGAAGAGRYETLSEMYARIRHGLQDVPDLFLVAPGRGGGEHHLFLRRSINARHPDYQLEVDDLASALFAIDVVTEQGEGGMLGAGDSGEDSHFASFLRMSELLVEVRNKAESGAGRPWSPAFPVVRNPTLRADRPARTLVTDPTARHAMRIFNEAYSVMLQLIVQHFAESPDGRLRRSVLMNSAIEVMNGLMRPVSELLVTLPSGVRGRTAGPSFELDAEPGPVPRPDVARRALARRFKQLARECAACPVMPQRVADSATSLARLFRDLDGSTTNHGC
ncbi:ferritin-like domain-containing protein [Pseudonocardia xinjiangensis]|uniref:ferritin-like domain-containing protein n=1 Tax=Pseudonocardia xinjiangensis TaxID=75289 RepID=UPI003D90F588